MRANIFFSYHSEQSFKFYPFIFSHKLLLLHYSLKHDFIYIMVFYSWHHSYFPPSLFIISIPFFLNFLCSSSTFIMNCPPFIAVYLSLYTYFSLKPNPNTGDQKAAAKEFGFQKIYINQRHYALIPCRIHTILSSIIHCIKLTSDEK